MNNTQHESRTVCCFPATEVQNKKTTEKSPFFSLSQLFERLAVRFTAVARIYFNIFYKSMLAKEVALAGLKPGAKILHIGGGAYPFTALYLARHGFRVDACDCNSTAVEISKNLVKKNGFEDLITIVHENGCRVDCSGYDAVWVSLNICPKERVLEQSWESLGQGGLLVYRKLPAWLAMFGKRDVDYGGDEAAGIKKDLSGLGAESVVLEKTSAEATGAVRPPAAACKEYVEKIRAIN